MARSEKELRRDKDRTRLALAAAEQDKLLLEVFYYVANEKSVLFTFIFAPITRLGCERLQTMRVSRKI
ncbi:hypothetical protein EON65_21620 [archaeon]|nr:MAG: hypothetical protein EON65_21620 [archaeon]